MMKQTKIKLPADYALEDGLKPGDTFEELVTFKLLGEGTVVPEKIAGIDIAAEDAEMEEDEEMVDEEAAAIFA